MAHLFYPPPPLPNHEAHNALVQPRVARSRVAQFVAIIAVVLIASLAGAQPGFGQGAPQLPAAPSGLQVSTLIGSLDVNLDWDDVYGATRYVVRWRAAEPGGKLNEGEEVAVSEAEITVEEDGSWVVRVQACNDAGCGTPTAASIEVAPAPETESEPVAVTENAQAQTIVTPPAPTALTVSAGTKPGSLDASWNAPSGVTVTDYDLRYYAGSADPPDEADWVEEREARGLPDPGRSTSATITRLKTDTVYQVQVRAANAAGEGAWSDSASARLDTTAPVLRIARVNSDGTELTLYYDDPLDSSSAPAHGRFSITVDGSKRTLSGDGAVTVSGSTVTMNLGNPAVTAGQAVMVSYDAAAAAKPIKNLKGLKAPGISGLAAINDRFEGAGIQSTLQTLEIVSTPTPKTDTYGAGAKIEVQLTFDENVTVDTVGGSPYLKIKLHADDTNTKRASYAGGSGTTALTFSYTVRSSDTSKGGTPETDGGIAVLENSLDFNGAWILSESTGRFINPNHAGLDHDADHKVDGTLDGKAPRFRSAVVNQLTLNITFDENLDTSSVPAAGSFCVDTTAPDGSARSFCGDSGSNVTIDSANNALVTVPLSEGVRSGEAVTLSYTVAGTNPLKDADGNKVASFSGRRVTNNSQAPGQPTGLFASASSLGGSLDVRWTAPDSGETPTGYELRYYQGAGDPPAGREADWIQDEYGVYLPGYTVAGLPNPGAGVTSATIEGLRANTVYRVQVRAKTAAEGGPWSASASAITGSPSATNNAPRVLRHNGATSGNVCSVVNVNGPIKREINIGATGALVSISGLGSVSGRTNGWPSECNTGPQADRTNPTFDDVDGDKLTFSIDRRSVPANVRVAPLNDFRVAQPGELHSTNTGHVFFQGESAFREVGARDVRARLTATDPHGASVSVRVYYIISTVANRFGAPSLPEVEDLDASPVRPFSHVLPAATGGDNFVSALTRGEGRQYYYAVSGLPEGLTFDPETRTIFGTPTETGSFSVTYTADDPDTVGSAYLNPETTAMNDVASRTFTINVRPFVGLVRVTSAPTHDANGDGINDTYGVGDKIDVDMEFFEPVEFDPGTGTGKNTVRMRLRVGRDGDESAGTLKTADLTDVLHGGKTLRFQYTVQSGDNDPDGVSIGSFGGAKADDLLALRGTATLTGLVSGEATSLKRSAYIIRNAVDENGLPLSYVNGWLNSKGPKPTAAHVDGETLTVTFDEDLAALSAADLQSLTYLFGVQGADGTGGNRNAFQHPSSVAMRSDNRTLELTLGVAARVGEQITLSYKLNNYQGPIKDTDDNMAPAFVHLMVTNNTGGGGGGGAAGAGANADAEVTLVSNTGQARTGVDAFSIDYAQAFTTGSDTQGYKLTSLIVPYASAVPPAGVHTISIHASNSSNRPGTSLGTLAYGTVSGLTVTYTASGEGISLAAGTTYFVVTDRGAGDTGDATRKRTLSDNEDAGAADGWSIGDGVLWRSATSTGSWNTVTSSWQIAIRGPAPPTGGLQPRLARVAGTKLKIDFDEALDATSSESGKHFEVAYSDRDGIQRTIAGTEADVAISDKTVTVTLAEAVPPNVTAQVTYEPPTLSLKAAEGNTYVAGFMGFKIETVYDTAVPELKQVAVVQTSTNPYGFRVALYYDEELDPDSVPATTDFGVALESNAALTPNTVAVEDNTVVLTLDLAKAPGQEVHNVTYNEADVSYTKGTNPIRDLAGNEAANVDKDDVSVEVAGTPAVVAATKAVKGDEVKLVGNSAQSNNGNSSFSVDRAQAFTTGSNAEGYKLTKLRIRYVFALPTAASHTIKIHASNSSNQPGGSLGTLSYGSASGFDVTYTAPGDGIALDAGTTYFAVLDFSSSGGTGFYRTTDSNAEDAGAAGWTLADGSFSKSMSNTAWTADTKSWKINLHGAALKPVAVTVTVPVVPATLVGNTGQTAGSPGPFSFDYSQAFTTGSNTDGYRLTSVTVPYNTAAPASSSHTISIHASNSSDRPDASLGTLGYGTVSGRTITYTASGNGIALDAETTYFLVIDVSGSPSSEINLTSSGAEDAGASDGWSLADGLLWRSSGSSGTWSTFSDTWQIAIQGTAVTKETATVTLVGNTGQSEDANRDFSLDVAQPFTTGSNTGGYKLTSVAVPYTGSAPAASSHEISIHASASGNVGTKLGTLSYGSVSGTTVTYTASGEGINLTAGTRYFVLFDPQSTPSGSQLRITNSFSEDAGAADGWSIANAHRTWAGPGNQWVHRLSAILQIAIHGVVNRVTTQIEKTAYALVDGASLTVTYDKSLDPTSLPDPERFTLRDDDGFSAGSVAAVAVAGKQLVLTLNGSVSPCEPSFTLSYSWSETEKNIRTFTGHEAPDIEAEPVINAQADRCVNGRAVVQNGGGASGNSGGGSGQAKQGKSLTVKFDGPLDTGKALKASAFGLAGAAGGAAPAVEEAAYTESGAGVALTLARALESGETLTLSYTRPAGQSGLWTAAGNQIAEFSGLTVPVRTSEAPAVTGVEVISDSGNDDTYALGETIRVRVTFSEAVEVDTTGGTPRLKIKMDPNYGEKWATYESGSGTAELVFVHEVVQPNESTQGIAVLADTLEANGGAIRSVSEGADAQLGQDGLDHDPAHKVDWRLAPAANVPATGAATITGTAQVGETLTADTSGISDADGLDNAVFSYQWLADDSDISGATGNTYTLAVADEGKAVKVQVSFTDDAGNDESLTSDATAAVAPKPNSAASGQPTISGTAQVGETLTAGTSGISDADGLDSATFSYQWVADDASISEATGSTYTLVDADEGKAVKVQVSFTDDAGHAETLTSEATSAVTAATPPDVTGVVIASRPANGNTYWLGETIRIHVTFSEAVEVTGTPRLEIDMDPAHWGAKWAAYESGSGTASLTFVHEVVQPNESTQGIALLANTLELNGGAIRSAETETDALLAHDGLAHDPGHKVDWQRVEDTTPPAVISAKVDGATVTVTFDEDLAPVSSVETLHFQWSILGTVVDQHPNRASVSGRTVTMEIGTPAVAGQTITVSYESSGHLKDADGNAVESFSVTATNLTR